MSETPLETARRVWPGEWMIDREMLYRGLIKFTGNDWDVHVYVQSFPSGWRSRANLPGLGMWSQPADLESTIITARDHVQALARAFAASVGVA